MKMKLAKKLIAGLLITAFFASCGGYYPSSHYRNVKKHRADRMGANHTPGF